MLKKQHNLRAHIEAMFTRRNAKSESPEEMALLNTTLENFRREEDYHSHEPGVLTMPEIATAAGESILDITCTA